MLLAVIGPRNRFFDISRFIPEGCTGIIVGGAPGIDAAAEACADLRGLPKLVFRSASKHFGKNAPLRRNRVIIDVADEVLTFWDGTSRVTKNVLAYARKTGKKVTLILLAAPKLK